jgi:hypothetical protein
MTKFDCQFEVGLTTSNAIAHHLLQLKDVEIAVPVMGPELSQLKDVQILMLVLGPD